MRAEQSLNLDLAGISSLNVTICSANKVTDELVEDIMGSVHHACRLKNLSNYSRTSTSNDAELINKASIIPDVKKLAFPYRQSAAFIL